MLKLYTYEEFFMWVDLQLRLRICRTLLLKKKEYLIHHLSLLFLEFLSFSPSQTFSLSLICSWNFNQWFLDAFLLNKTEVSGTIRKLEDTIKIRNFVFVRTYRAVPLKSYTSSFIIMLSLDTDVDKAVLNKPTDEASKSLGVTVVPHRFHIRIQGHFASLYPSEVVTLLKWIISYPLFWPSVVRHLREEAVWQIAYNESRHGTGEHPPLFRHQRNN